MLVLCCDGSVPGRMQVVLAEFYLTNLRDRLGYFKKSANESGILIAQIVFHLISIEVVCKNDVLQFSIIIALFIFLFSTCTSGLAFYDFLFCFGFCFHAIIADVFFLVCTADFGAQQFCTKAKWALFKYII